MDTLVDSTNRDAQTILEDYVDTVDTEDEDKDTEIYSSLPKAKVQKYTHFIHEQLYKLWIYVEPYVNINRKNKLMQIFNLHFGNKLL